MNCKSRWVKKCAIAQMSTEHEGAHVTIHLPQTRQKIMRGFSGNPPLRRAHGIACTKRSHLWRGDKRENVIYVNSCSFRDTVPLGSDMFVAGALRGLLGSRGIRNEDGKLTGKWFCHSCCTCQVKVGKEVWAAKAVKKLGECASPQRILF